MNEPFKDYLESPTLEKYLALRESIITHESYNPYSTELEEIDNLLEQNEFEKVTEFIKVGFPNLFLSPRFHMYLGVAFDKLGKTEEADTEKALFTLCIDGLLKTGDGSKDNPYIVTRVNDEYDLLFILEKEHKTQALINHNGVSMDALTLTDGSTLYFDITDCLNRLNNIPYTPRSNEGKTKKKWWQFWK